MYLSQRSETILMGGVAVLQGTSETRSLITPYPDKRSQFTVLDTAYQLAGLVYRSSPIRGLPHAH